MEKLHTHSHYPFSDYKHTQKKFSITNKYAWHQVPLHIKSILHTKRPSLHKSKDNINISYHKYVIVKKRDIQYASYWALDMGQVVERLY